MIKVLLYIIIIIPMGFIDFSWLLSQIIYLFLYMIFLVSGSNYFFRKISYFLGIDTFSYNLILLGFLVRSYIVISISNSPNIYLFMFINLNLIIFLLVIFSSINFLYIYISFEFVLVPLLLLILGWGYQPERLIAGLYLFFYTVLVSLPLLILILILYNNVGCLFFDYLIFNSNFLLIHLILILVFIVKLPIFLVHFWLPKAHVQAPVSGSIILAGLILKIGGYGLIRTIYIYEYIYINYSYIWFSLSIIGSFLIGILCLIQGDIKCLIAYSSISHIGIVIIGLITIRKWGLIGSYLLILGHGFCSSGLFYIANLFYIRTGSRRFYINKGLISYIPRCSIILFMFCSFNISCPPRINFISELIILRSIMMYWWFSLIFFIGISFLCACFRYYLYRYSQHGTFHNLYRFSSINLIEFLCLFIHLIPLFFYPLIIINLF